MARIRVDVSPRHAYYLLRFAIGQITEDEWDQIFQAILKHSDEVEEINNIKWKIDDMFELARVSDDDKNMAIKHSSVELSHVVHDIVMNHLEFYNKD